MTKTPKQTALKLRRVRRSQSVTLERYCELTGRQEMDCSTLGTLAAYTREHGLRVVSRWISTALERLGRLELVPQGAGEVRVCQWRQSARNL